MTTAREKLERLGIEVLSPDEAEREGTRIFLGGQLRELLKQREVDDGRKEQPKA